MFVNNELNLGCYYHSIIAKKLSLAWFVLKSRGLRFLIMKHMTIKVTENNLPADSEYSIIGVKNILKTSEGYEMIGAKEALLENLTLYPTYDKLQLRHTDYFGVKEKIHTSLI
jgi:hypothetical protein